MRKTKSISFDLNDAHELKLLQHAESKPNGKFSRYIKRLIEDDLKGVTRTPNVMKEAVQDNDISIEGFI